MKVSVRGVLLAAVALLTLCLAPGVAQASGTFYARGGGGNGGASCALGDECPLPEAVKKANEAGDGSEIVLVPGPAFSPNKELTVDGKILIGGEAGAPRPRIIGPEGVEVALRLRDGAEIHDADVVAGANSAALRLWDAAGERVTATSASPGEPACELEEFAALSDSVCHATDGDALAAFGFGFVVQNVDAIGGQHGIMVAGETGIGNRFAAWDTIAVGGPGFSDLAAETPDNKDVGEIKMHGSAYDSIDEGAHPGAVSITPPGAQFGVTAAPQLVDPVAGDFHELPSSPTVDAGETFEKQSALDLDRTPRALTAHPACGGSPAGQIDIGAYEYVPVLDCSPAPPPAPNMVAKPPAPGTTLKKAKIDSDKGTASFIFAGSGAISGFACELVRPAPKGAKSSKGAKRSKPKFAPCKSPRTYRRLVPGAYTFEVEAQGPDGADPTPAVRKFRIQR
jgi:hypothetical protein